MNKEILITESQKDYELLDSGNNEKLERFGKIIIRRPDPQALWKPRLDESDWNKATARFPKKEKSGWQIDRTVPDSWMVDFDGLRFLIKPSTFKHVGIFPEQTPNWDWLKLLIEQEHGRAVNVLNLFGYTGGATLACAQAGASIVHVDASKVAISWAKENAKLSGIENKPIRWILDDATAFVKREIRRERRYDIIIMDPPAFGHGPDGELWKIEENLLELIDLCRQLLSDNPLCVLINGYASGYSSLAYQNNMEDFRITHGGKITNGELTIRESNSERLLPCGIFARWERN